MDLSSEKIKSSYKSAKRTEEKHNIELLRRKYTTRQIMELMELRRRKMAELQAADMEIGPTSKPFSAAIEPERAVVAQALERSLQRPRWSNELDSVPVAPAVVVGPAEAKAVAIADPGVQGRVTVEVYDEPWFAAPARHLNAMFEYLGKAVVESVLTAGAFALFFVMLTHILSARPSAGYEQGQFIFLAVLLTAWMKRRRLDKGTKAFWLGMVAFASGAGIFYYGFLKADVYLELIGFVATAAGILCARHTKEGANRAVFPLLCLAFVIPPPDALAGPVANTFNLWTQQASAFLLGILHIPSSWSGNIFSAGGYEFASSDQTVFRFAVVTLPLAALWLHHRLKRRHRQWVVMLAALPIAVLAGIIHMTGTGWVAYTYGNPYADGFYGLAGIILFAVLGVFAAIDSVTAEDDHF